jgi:K+-sensing histidine kinase KdpD
MSERPYLNAKHALITVGSIATAYLLRTLIDAVLHEPVAYTTFYLAVMVSALYCGPWWGMACTVLSAAAAEVAPPPFRLLITEANDLASLALFLIVSSLIVLLSHRMRQHQHWAEQEAEQKHDLLLREREARREAERLNRAKDDFLAAVSHELRTPLQSILGWAQLLGQCDMDHEETELAAASIERSVVMQTQLINDLLDLSRMFMGKLRLDMRPVSLDAIVSDAVQTVLPTARAKEVAVTVTCTTVGCVLGDAD